MKKIILGLTMLAFVGAHVQTASAGDREWATAGKILTGVAAASIIAHAVDYQPGYYSSGYYAPAPPVYYAPPQVVYAPPPLAPWSKRSVKTVRYDFYSTGRVVFCPPRVYVPAAPVFSFSFGGGAYYPRHSYYGGYNGCRPHYRVCR